MANTMSSKLRYFRISAAALVATLSFCSCSVLASIGWNPAGLASAATKAMTAASISDEQIIQLSAQSVAQMDRQNTVDTGAYSQRLSKLLSGVQVDGLPLNFKVYKTQEVNAFACADGSIRVYSGLMDVMEDGELMAIIGHEIGHVVHQDSKNSMKKAYLASAARDLIGSAGSVGAISSAVLGDISEAFVQAKFSQKQEFAADEYGYEFSIRNNQSPYSMATALEKLVNMSQGQKASAVAQMFSSHPDSALRAEKVRKKADDYTKNKK